ncbi:MAG: PelD GGDEF domain-containing protein, partial [Planctomycetota bacterium]
DLQETLSVGDARAADRRSEDVDVLVAIPLVDSFQRIWGVVAVQDLPFVGLEEENLTLMAILGRALGDQLSVTMEATEADLDEARFRSHLRRSLKDLVDHDLPATVVVYRLDQVSTTGGTVEFLMRQKRGLDVGWHDDNADGDPFVALLLPLNGSSGADGYLTRIAGMFRRRWGKSMDESGVRITTFDLSEADTVEAVVKEIRRSRRTVESEDTHLAGAHA